MATESREERAREALCKALTDSMIPKDMIDGILQRIEEAGIYVMLKSGAAADWSGFDNSVETGGPEAEFSRLYF